MSSVRRAKILATLGPSSNESKTIEDLIKSGMNAVRINMSHGTYDQHEDVIKKVRSASKSAKREVALLMDLQGPKIRVDNIDVPIELKAGDLAFIGTKEALESNKELEGIKIPTVYKNLVKDASAGNIILFDDGLIEAKAVEKNGELLKIEILSSGTLKSKKGINLPDCNISAPSLTEKDRKDLEWGLEQGIDYVALSFVREASDIEEVKKIIHSHDKKIPVVAKIEKPEAIEAIDEIIKASDVIMIARGDMAVEIGNHLVPAIQKKIINKCNAVGKTVITATQMLESMIDNLSPTRAEASDVANAIWDGTDVVMLSGETAVGIAPVKVVKTMSQIIEEAEKLPKERPLLRDTELNDITATNQVAASLIAEKIKAKWIISMTESGNSPRKMARFRPRVQVLAVTNSLSVVRKICLYWGIKPYYVEVSAEDVFYVEHELVEELKSKNLVSSEDKLVITHGGGKLFKEGNSNLIRVESV